MFPELILTVDVFLINQLITNHKWWDASSKLATLIKFYEHIYLYGGIHKLRPMDRGRGVFDFVTKCDIGGGGFGKM
jgi:hypothetical protein